MGLYPNDFGFEETDAIIQFILRIGVQTLQRELAGRVSAPPGEIVLVHCNAAFPFRRLLSMDMKFTQRGQGWLSHS